MKSDGHHRPQLTGALDSVWILYLIILFSILNPILRVDKANPFTLYRILAPILACYYIYFSKSNINTFGLFSLLLIYNIIVTSVSGYSTIYSNVYMIHYLYLFILFFFITVIKNKLNEKFDEKMFLFFRYITYFIYTIFFIKFFFKLNVFYNFDSLYYINTFYSTPNDLALSLSAIFAIFLCNTSVSRVEKIINIAIIFFINYYNDAKAAILAQFIIISTYLLVLLFKRFHKHRSIILAGITSSFILLAVSIKNFAFKFKYGEITFSDFIVTPFLRILELEPYRLMGSIYDRADVAIFALIEFCKSFGLGMGAGASIEVLKLDYYSTSSAKSLHNFLLEWLVEFGWLAVILYILVFILFYRSLKKINTPAPIELVVILPSIPLLSVSQSSGYISNYLFWAIIFYVFIKTIYSPLNKKSV